LAEVMAKDDMASTMERETTMMGPEIQKTTIIMAF